MTNGLLVAEPRLVTNPLFDLRFEGFGARTEENTRISAKQSREDFAERLNRIRKKCPTSYHRELLQYFPDPVTARPSSSPRTSSASVSRSYDTGVWYTDPHLLCRRSDAAKLMHALHRVLGRCRYAVSVGDKWDFGWSEVANPIDTAVKHEIQLAKRYPNCKFIIIPGNHDGSDDYIGALQEAATQVPNIEVHRYAAKIGRYLFTHGDCVGLKEPTVEALDKYRRSYHQGWTPNLAERCFDRAIHLLGLHCKVPEHLMKHIIPRNVQAKRILSFIRGLDPSLLDGVEVIGFGHTHDKFNAFDYEGYRFRNGGAHEKGFKPALHRFSIAA